jgi:hypothetical protein
MTEKVTFMHTAQQSEKIIENLVSKIPEVTQQHCTARQ